MEDKIILYQNTEGNVSINVTYIKDSFWLTQKTMAQLFNCSMDNISLHLKNIFNEEELHPDSVTEDFSATASDGKQSKISHKQAIEKVTMIRLIYMITLIRKHLLTRKSWKSFNHENHGSDSVVK